MTDKNTLISSMFSKVKDKKGKKQVTFLQSIGNIKYKYTLFKAKDDGCYHKNYVTGFSLIDRSNSMIFHVLDDEFGMFLYDVLNNNEFDFESTPDELKDMNFVAVKKLQKVVFISFEETNVNKYFLCEHYGDTTRVLNNLYNIFNWFEKNFVFEEKRLNINYIRFFQSMFGGYGEFLPSLFKAFYISDSSYELKPDGLDIILDILFSYFGVTTLSDIRRKISFNTELFYQFTNQGIYMKELDSHSHLYCLPSYLRGNILNYVINDSYYDNLKDIFKYERENINEDDNFVFNQNLFMQSLRVKEENIKLVVYENRDNKNLEYAPTFIKVKEEAQFDKFRKIVSALIKGNLISNASVIYSPAENSYYLSDYTDYSNQIKLCDYVKTIVGNQDELCNLLLMVKNAFSDKADIKQKVFIKEAETYLENLSINKQTGEIKFTNIAKISFAKEKGYTSFYYQLCMMQIVESFLSYSNMTAKELYKCDFAKLFSQSFMSSIIDYLNTKQYKDKGMIGKLRGTLIKDDVGKIEFLENIDLADENLLQRISLNPSYKYMFPLISASVEKAKMRISASKTARHVALDDFMEFVTKHKDLTLSRRLIDKLTSCPNMQNFLIPEKLILSKDIHNEKNYIVIGVIWSKNKLYRLSDLIATKEITTKNIYSTVVLNTMKMYELYYIAVDKLKRGICSLLVDDNYNIVIDCNSYTSINDVTGRIKSQNIYYTDIMRLIVKEYGDKLEKFTYFTHGQLFKNLENYIWEEAFDRIRFCTEHDRLYLQGEMCEECEEVYVLKDQSTSLEFLLEMCNGKYEYFNLNSNRVLSSGISQDIQGVLWRTNKNVNKTAADRVRVGIQNGIYKKFIALVPNKIVIQDYDGDREKYGILLDNYDFSNMVEIYKFNYIQRLKVVLMIYKKILPYIEDGSFVTKTGSIFFTMFMDKEHKGEFIFPNLPLLDTICIAFGNADEKQKGKEITLKILSEFLYNYLLSDEGFCVEMKKNDPLLSMVLKSIKNCDFHEKYIRAYLATKDAYCNVHGVHFSSSDKLCPECIAEGIDIKNILVLDKTYYNDLKAKSSDFEGGEANLYFNDDGTIDKIFNDEVDISFKSKVLGKALQKEEAFKAFNEDNEDIKFASIYKLLYSFENGILNLEGYRQECIADSYKISSFKDKNFVEEKGYTKKDIIQILIKVCKGIEFLHSIGGFIGDLNGGNILIKDKSVYFIDKDGMSFDDVKNYVYTNLYIYPSSAENKNITKEDDWYSLAIQAFYYLTYSHPFRGVCDKPSVPKNELERMKKGYSVLGNHGIIPPSVSVGWDLMPSKLVGFFLNTFEGTKRESMLETLDMYLKYIDKNEMDFREIIRKGDVKHNITENIYIDTQGLLYFKEKSICTGIQEGKIYVINDNVLILTNTETLVVNDKTGNAYMLDKSYESIKYVYYNRIYYTLNNDTNIYIDEFDLKSKNISTYVLKRKTQNKVCAINGYRNDKFVIVEENSIDNTYDIYCNMIKVCALPQNEFYNKAEVDILHDEITDKWLIIMLSENNIIGIVIDKNGEYMKFDLRIENDFSPVFAFYKNVLYFVGEKKIYMYSTSKNELKSVYCSLSMPFTSIKRKDNKFVIINQKAYAYEKS